MSIENWMWFCAIEFVLCLSPGPSVLLARLQLLDTENLR